MRASDSMGINGNLDGLEYELIDKFKRNYSLSNGKPTID
jgi:hypothetical protein